MRVGILKGIRGPRGGYELARERRRITADDILRAAGTIEDASDPAATAGSALLNDVVIPAVGQAERAFSVALSRINLDDLVRKAEPLRDATTLIESPACNTSAPSPAFTVWTLSARFPLCVKSQ